MGYSEHIWLEHTGSAADKTGWLNNCETQYTEGCDYLDAIDHAERYYTKVQMDDKYFTAANDGAGSTLVCETLDGYTAAQLLAAGAPPGVIVYYQSLTPPAGWALCNGVGTPNLAGRFIVGSGDTYNPGGFGGSHTITITASVTVGAHALTVDEMPAHDHDADDYYGINPGFYHGEITGSGASNMTDVTWGDHNTNPSGSSSTHTHISSFSGSANQEKRPPFYTLAAIQKS